MVAGGPLHLSLRINVIVDDVCSERDNGDAKAREEVSERGRLREYGVVPPRVTLGPWITVEGSRHACTDAGRRIRCQQRQ